MSTVAAVVVACLVFDAGLLFGAFLAGVGRASRTTLMWEVQNRDGHTYLLDDPHEVQAALAVDGFLSVRRLTVIA